MSHSRTIVFVATSFGDALHGPEVFARNLWRTLRPRTDLDFHVVAPSTLSVPDDDDHLHLVATSGGSVSFYRQIAQQAVDIAAGLDPTAIVHFNIGHMPLPDIPEGIRTIGHINDPWAATVHPLSPRTVRARGLRRTMSLAWRHRRESANVRQFDMVVANSVFMRSVILDRYRRVDPARVVVLHKSVDVDFFLVDRPPQRLIDDGPLRAAYIGANMFQKGFDVVLEALAATTFPVHLDVIGPTPAEVTARYGALLDALPASCSVDLRGPLDRAAIRGALHASHVLVSPARGEAFGVTTLEALASGCYVIASTGGGSGEILGDSGCGELIPPDSVDDLVRALGSVATDHPFAAADFADRTLAVATRFSLDTMIANLLSIYDSV